MWNYDTWNLMCATCIGDQVCVARARTATCSLARSLAWTMLWLHMLLQILFYHLNCQAIGESTFILVWRSDRCEHVRNAMRFETSEGAVSRCSTSKEMCEHSQEDRGQRAIYISACLVF